MEDDEKMLNIHLNSKEKLTQFTPGKIHNIWRSCVWMFTGRYYTTLDELLSKRSTKDIGRFLKKNHQAYYNWQY
jgi:hypothetical protein